MSPRNSADAVVNMLEKTSCHRIISQASLTHLMDEVVALCTSKGHKLKVDELMSLDDLFPTLGQSCPVARYPSSPRISARDDTTLILHSSGTTGFPKAIPLTQFVLLQWMDTGMPLLRLTLLDFLTNMCRNSSFVAYQGQEILLWIGPNVSCAWNRYAASRGACQL